MAKRNRGDGGGERNLFQQRNATLTRSFKKYSVSSAKDVAELLMDSKRVKVYNKMSQGRTDVKVSTL